METLELSLPERLKIFIETEAIAGGHASANDFVLAVLKDLEMKRAWAKAEQLVLEGLNSGPAVPMDAAFWEEMHRELRDRYPEVDNP